MKTNGGFLVTKIKQLGDRIFEKILSEKNIDAFNGAQGRILYVLWQEDGISIRSLSVKCGLAITSLKVVFFAGYVAAPQDDAWEIGFTEAEFEVWLQNAADRSCFTSEIAPIASDRILTLSTCSYEFDDARFVLAGVLR